METRGKRKMSSIRLNTAYLGLRFLFLLMGSGLLLSCSTELRVEPRGDSSAASATYAEERDAKRTFLVELDDMDDAEAPLCLSKLHRLFTLKKLQDSNRMFYSRFEPRQIADLKGLRCVRSVIEAAEHPYIVELVDLESQVDPQCLADAQELATFYRSGYSLMNFKVYSPDFVAYEIAQLECVTRVSLKPLTGFVPHLFGFVDRRA